MDNSIKKQVVPPQEEGLAITAESAAHMPNEKSAITFFETVKKRLQDVNHWQETAGGLSARFRLMNENGEPVERSPQVGDFFRIDIPGPGAVSGQGFDWVRVEEVSGETKTGSESYGLRVRPVQNPESGEKGVAHFFSSDSTSSFIVTREGTKITASVFDRNTKPNTDAQSIAGKIRDLITGSAGILIFSKLQWKKLTEGLLDSSD